MFQITGKVALITGGVSGIGLEITKTLLENGLKAVAIVDINEANGKTALENIKKLYGDNKAIFIKTDVADENQFDNAFKSTVEAFQNLDIVINSAGIGSDKDWKREIEINLTGTVTGTILAVENYLPKFRTSNDAVVLNISSIAALDCLPCAPVYTATKSGIVGLTQSFGTKFHYEKNKVRVMVMCPGFTNTSFLHINKSMCLNDNIYEMFVKLLNEVVFQDVSNVSKTAIEMIKGGENGSIWVVKDDQPAYEVEILYRQKLKM